MDLFAQTQPKTGPLAELLRPQNIEDFVGQEKILHHSGLYKLVKNKARLPNLIFWGPPGTGKTTLARLLAKHVEAQWLSVNAVETGAKQLRDIGNGAYERRLQWSQQTLLFIDEIHRLNKAQQDVLLPFAERGDLTLIGATTENPSYELNAALLSRCRVLTFERLSENELTSLLKRACQFLEVKHEELLDDSARMFLLRQSDGDGRRLISLIEEAHKYWALQTEAKKPLTEEVLARTLQQQPFYYDKSADEHYDCISAFIKSVRGSDPSAAVYYLARMLEGGEDPVFIARRLVILASEDIGNADPRGLSVAVAGLQAVELIGLPEAAINLAQVTTYLASAPKSNKAYMALRLAQAAVKQHGRQPIPLALRSSQTPLNKQMGYGKDYKYSHDGERGFVKQDFLPQSLIGQEFYKPTDRGFEKNIRAYLDWVRQKPQDEPEE